MSQPSDRRGHRSPVSRRWFLRQSLLAGTGAALGAAFATGLAGSTAAAAPVPAVMGARVARPWPAPRADDPPPTSGGELIFALRSEPDNLDPNVTPFAVSHVVMMNCYDTLVWQDTADRQFKGGLAESWETSSDGTAYTFRLKSGVRFHDGTPFNAAAVKFNFDRIADPATKSGFAATLLGPYDRTDVIDDTTLTLRLKAPFPPLLDSLSQAFLGMASPSAIQKYGSEFGQNPVGTGAFIFKEWVPKDHISFTRNPDYNWAPPFFRHQGPAYLQDLTFKIIPENASRITSLEANDTNFIEYVPEQDFARIRDDSKYRVVIGDIPGVPSHIVFNSQREPLNDPAVRQALMYGLDRPGIIQTAYFGLYQPVYGPLSPGTICASTTFDQMYPHDAKKAADLLDGAGWMLGSDGIRSKDGKQLSLDFVIDQPGLPLVQTVQGQLRDIGINVESKVFVTATRVQMGQNGEQHIGSNGWISSDPGVLANLFHSKNIGAWNWARTNDSKLDSLLDEGLRAGGDLSRRCQIYDDAEKIIMDQAVFYPIYQARRLNAARGDVYGIRMDVRGGYPWLYDAYISK